mgnify:CR=1 FL=1
MDNTTILLDQSTNDEDITTLEDHLYSLSQVNHNIIHISEELRQFIVKITAKCEHCGLPKYIRDPYRKTCPNKFICDFRRSAKIKIRNQPYNYYLDVDELIATVNGYTDNNLILRTDLTKLLMNYINIQCKVVQDKTRKIHFHNRNFSYDTYTSIIYPNEDIKKLFKLSDTDELTSSNIQ